MSIQPFADSDAAFSVNSPVVKYVPPPTSYGRFDADFSVNSPVVQYVPPPTFRSNVQTAEAVQQYAVRPDKQFYASLSMTDSAGLGAILTIRGTKNLMITKVFVRKRSLGSGNRYFRMFLVNAATGSQIGDMMLFFDPGATSTIFMDVCDLSFNPPFFVNLDNGNAYLQLDCSGLAVGEYVYCHVFGFYVD